MEERYCPYCDERIICKPPDYLDMCPTHGILEGDENLNPITQAGKKVNHARD